MIAANTNRFIPSGDFALPVVRQEHKPMTARATVIALLDAFAECGYAHTTLFELAMPGATEAARAWCAVRSIKPVEYTDSFRGTTTKVLMITVESGAWLEIRQ